MGQQSLVWPATTGGTPPGQTGIAASQATAVEGWHVTEIGTQWKVGQQSVEVPISSFVPGGHAGAGVAGHGVWGVHTG